MYYRGSSPLGKRIGGAVYLHRSCVEDYIRTCTEEDAETYRIASFKLPRFEYKVIKLNQRTGDITYIASPDFDTANEPISGEKLLYKASEGWVYPMSAPRDPLVFHHKWMMVKPGYGWFDVEAAKERSRWWTGLSGIDRKRIGKKSVWEREILMAVGMDHRASDLVVEAVRRLYGDRQSVLLPFRRIRAFAAAFEPVVPASEARDVPTASAMAAVKKLAPHRIEVPASVLSDAGLEEFMERDGRGIMTFNLAVSTQDLERAVYFSDDETAALFRLNFC